MWSLDHGLLTIALRVWDKEPPVIGEERGEIALEYGRRGPVSTGAMDEEGTSNVPGVG